MTRISVAILARARADRRFTTPRFRYKGEIIFYAGRVSKADLSEWDAICTHKALGLLQDSRWRKSRKSSFLLRAITPRWRRNTCTHTHVHLVYISLHILGKMGKRPRKLSKGVRGREREELMRRGMMEFANHPALHFSLPCSRFSRSSSKSSSPHSCSSRL